jgi:transposase
MSLKVSGEELKTFAMDHHGIVASVCKDLRIAEKIDKRISNGDKRRVVSPGKAVVAMILNGLGFTNRRLYLTHQFFENKPVERLLDEQIMSDDITDYTLGHTLDEISKYGTSQLFGEVAFETAIENNLLGQLSHLDTTSFTVYGDYERHSQTGEPSTIEVTYGHSKDHRPDLKQVVLSLVVNGPSSMPLFMEPLNGNNSDKESFHATIERVKKFQKEINLEKNFKWVADSALYTKAKLLQLKDTLWLTRVPETIKEAKNLVSKPTKEIDFREQGNGYKIAEFTSSHGTIEQRWLLVYSEHAYQREKKTFEKNLKKKEDALKKAVWHLGNEVFDSLSKAKSALKALIKKYKLHRIQSQIIPILKYTRPGKPKAEDEKVVTGYRVGRPIARIHQRLKNH